MKLAISFSRFWPRSAGAKLCFAVAVLLLVNTGAITFTAIHALDGTMREEIIARQSGSMRTAAAVLKERFPDTEIVASNARVNAIQLKAIPSFSEHGLVDQISFATGDTATVFEFDAASGDFVRRTTSVKKPDGSRAVGTVLGKAGAVQPVVMRGEVFTGEAEILGTPFYTQYVPILGPNKSVIGILYVGTKKAVFEAVRSSVVTPLIEICLAAGLVLLLAAMVLARRAIRPLNQLRDTIAAVASGDAFREVPHQQRTDEFGDMARAVVVFQGHAHALGLAESEKLARDAQVQRERAEMMRTLTDKIGTVVEAATSGDFSRRVGASFSDPELQSLAENVDRLIETVDHGLGETTTVLSTLTKGDLTARIQGKFEGAFEILKSGTNTLADRLSAALTELSDAASAVRSATSEIALGVDDLSQRTADQAAAAGETSTALAEFAQAVQENAAKAGEASTKANGAEDGARQGGTVLNSARAAMHRIDQSSSQIAEIIDLIDGIAFQTNLLALNAAVEAARAGDAGRGFAVVAAEVRSLAQRAAQASSQIKALVTQAQTEVSSGVSLVEETATKLSTIFEAIAGVTALMSEIAESSNVHANVIQGLAKSVDRMGDMAQQNAALVEETHAAITVTEQQTQRLEQLASRFTLQSEGGLPMAKRPARAA